MTNLSPRAIEEAMSAAMRLLATMPPDSCDDLIRDTLEGQTEFFEKLDALVEQAIADSKLSDMASERAKRLEKRADKPRAIILAMLEALALRTVERPLYTATVSHTAKAMVTDAEQLPDEFVRRAADMIAIRKALTHGEAVSGATLSNPQPVLTIRTQ